MVAVFRQNRNGSPVVAAESDDAGAPLTYWPANAAPTMAPARPKASRRDKGVVCMAVVPDLFPALLQNLELAGAAAGKIDDYALLQVRCLNRVPKLFEAGNRFLIDLGDDVAGPNALAFRGAAGLHFSHDD